jgi:hypothetical protein
VKIDVVQPETTWLNDADAAVHTREQDDGKVIWKTRSLLSDSFTPEDNVLLDNEESFTSETLIHEVEYLQANRPEGLSVIRRPRGSSAGELSIFLDPQVSVQPVVAFVSLPSIDKHMIIV